MSKFKIGDKVRILGYWSDDDDILSSAPVSNSHMFFVGDEVIIDGVFEEGTIDVHYSATLDNTKWYISDEEAELVI